MSTQAQSTRLLRDRSGDQRVTNIELFFDLVYVFAVTQLSHYLLSDPTLRGALQSGLLLLMVWVVWSYTTWVTNWLDPEQMAVRLLLVVLMLVSLAMSAALPRAFGDLGLAVGLAYAIQQVGRTVFMVVALRGHPLQANFERILAWCVVGSAFGYQGQKCSACSRAIVLEPIHDVFLSRLIEATRSLKIAHAEDPGSSVGPLIDAEARQRVLEYINIGKTEGRLVYAAEVGELATEGYYAGPHIFADVPPTARIAQEEIFGPVLAVMRASNLDQALEIANGTAYALTGGLYSRSPEHVARIRREFRVGNLYINRKITGALVDRQPFGGFAPHFQEFLRQRGAHVRARPDMSFDVSLRAQLFERAHDGSTGEAILRGNLAGRWQSRSPANVTVEDGRTKSDPKPPMRRNVRFASRQHPRQCGRAT